MWKTILTSIGSTGILLTLVVLLIRSIIKHLLNKDITVFKNKLQENSKQQVAEFKHNLEKSALEHRIRFSKLHEERAVVIKEIYTRYIDFELSMKKFVAVFETNDGPTKEELKKEVISTGNKFFDYLKDKRIFFAKKTCSLIDEIEDFQKEKWTQFEHGRVYKSSSDETAGQQQERINKWFKIDEAIRTTGKELKSNLENKFRIILGVKEVEQ